MHVESSQSRGQVRTIGPNGQLQVVEYTAPQPEPSAAARVAQDLGIPYQSGAGASNETLTSEDAGAIGGHIGGPMVAKMISLARDEMAKAHVSDLIARQKK